jgi:hypothetical protein
VKRADAAGDRQVQRAGAGREAVEVAIETKRTVIVSAQTFEDAVAVEQAVIANGDGRLCAVHDLAIQVDLHG